MQAGMRRAAAGFARRVRVAGMERVASAPRLWKRVAVLVANPRMSNPTRTYWIQPAYKFR
jgi:hypothetical protein